MPPFFPKVPLRVSLRTPLAGWDLFFTVGVGVLLVFLPAAYGGVEAWAELPAVAIVALLSLGVVVRTLGDPLHLPAASWAYVPLAAIAGLATLQLATLPAAATRALAPGNAAVRTELLGPELAGDAFPISLAPQATAHDLRLTLVACGLFFAGASAFRTREQILRLLVLIVIAGAAEAVLALLQILTLTPNVYWSLPGLGRVHQSGSFINYSHFAQFMNLSLGAGLALLLVRLNHDAHESAGSRRIGESDLGIWKRHAYLIEALGVMALSVLLCRSRNGAMSMAVAATVVGGLLWRRGTLGARGWALAAAPLLALGLLFVLGFDDFYKRMATLQGGDDLAFRKQLTAGTLAAWRAFPMIGAGLGTHQYVFPLFGTSSGSSIAEHADNDWAQLLEEFGAIGFAAVMAFVGVIAVTTWRLMRGGRSSLAMAAFGLAFGFLATAMQSLSDFGQRTPAVFALTLLCSAAIVNIARLEKEATARQRLRRREESPPRRSSHGGEPLTIDIRQPAGDKRDGTAETASAEVAAADAGGAAGSGASEAADGAPAAPRAAARRAGASRERLEEGDAAQSRSSSRRSGDRRSSGRGRSGGGSRGEDAGRRHARSGTRLVSSRQQRAVRAAAAAGCAALAAVWAWALAGAVRAYQAENYALASRTLENEARLSGPLSDDDYADLLWTAERACQYEPGHPRYVYRLNALRWEAMSRQRDPETDGVVLDVEALPLVERLADELRAARTLAPTFGPPHALEGLLRRWVLDDPAGAPLIENGYRLAPYNSLVCLAMAELRAREGRTDEAFSALERAVRLEAGLLETATAMCLRLLDRPDLAEKLAAGNHGRLAWLAAQYAKEPRYAERIEPVRALAEQTLREVAASDAGSAGEIAAVAALDATAGDIEAAVDGYRRALVRDYAQTGWRLSLAQLLVQLERYDEAVREARICLRLKPGLQGAQDIVGEHGR